MHVREFRPGEEAFLARLYARSVEGLGPRHYSQDQVRVWAALGPSPEKLAALANDGRLRLVVTDSEDAPLGFVDLELDGHIDLFYLAPEAASTGAAALLYGAVEDRARASQISRLYAEASAGARRFFEKQGFTTLGRRDLIVDGVSIHNFAVEKFL